MESSDKVKCGSKRNFDVAFLSGENDIDREEKEERKKQKDGDKQTDTETNIKRISTSPLGKLPEDYSV